MQSKTTAKDFFLYLGIVIGLYLSSVSFLVLVFQIINKLFPLAGDYIGYGNYLEGNIDSAIRSSIATLIVFFPAFIYVEYLINKDLKANPEKKDIWVRKWIKFLTLFITGLTMIATLAVTIYMFLGAEDLTFRFFLKVFFVFATAIIIFISVLKDLKRNSFEITKNIKIFIGIISIIILSTIIYGIIILGSPNFQRARMMDETRISDLSNIQNQIVYVQWQNKGTVPASLMDLKDPISEYMLPTDPETKQNYEYTMLSKNSFELCATFKTVSILTTPKSVSDSYSYSYSYSSGETNENWQHKAERTCFTRTIDEKLYPVNPSRENRDQKVNLFYKRY